jgi:glycerol-3-phosphate cytidylyltransferase
MTRVITFGTFDIFHVGHLSLLERSAALGSHLSVGVSSDELNESKKGRRPVYGLEERLRILAALRVVDAVFIEESLEAKADYIRHHRAEVLVMGDDWRGRFDHLAGLCRVVYLPRTPSISTSATIEKIKQ